MIRKRPEKDLENPPGQIHNPIPGPDTLQHNIKEWEKYESSRNKFQRFLDHEKRLNQKPKPKPLDKSS